MLSISYSSPVFPGDRDSGLLGSKLGSAHVAPDSGRGAAGAGSAHRLPQRGYQAAAPVAGQSSDQHHAGAKGRKAAVLEPAHILSWGWLFDGVGMG